jgi:threonine aldolase
MGAAFIDLRSDTATLPTHEMREAMYHAELGDDVLGEDPTVNKLEEMAAERMGKEAAVLVTAGTQGNLCGVLSHTQRGDEVIVGDQAHVFHYEVAGGAIVGGLQYRTVPNQARGVLRPDDVRAAIRGENIHYPRTGCVCMENTHNRCGGGVQTLAEMKAVSDVAHENGVPVHLDGARVFNASVALGVPAKSLAATVDSVTFCLSKGLSAPVGSLLCGSREYIERARKYRKLLGGGMRQAGVLAAAGIVALESMVNRLAEDHENARRLAFGLAELPGVTLDPSAVQTNIIFFDLDPSIDVPAFLAGLSQRGVKAGASAPHRIRVVTHYGICSEDIDQALVAVRQTLSA